MRTAPVWSVMIPTYNASKYLANTLESVLAQNYEVDKMEIVIVDNCSTDDTKLIVERIGKDRVRWTQNETNIGMINNFNRCIEIAQGDYIHILNADDLVKEGYYDKFTDLFQAYPNVGLISCTSEVIDDDGNFLSSMVPCKTLSSPTNNVEELMYFNHLRTPAVSVRKSAYEKVGVFNKDFLFAFDWEMWVRIIFNCKGLQISDYLCEYRLHSSNETALLTISGKNILDIDKVMQKFYVLGYPIDMKKSRLLLKEITENQYDALSPTDTKNRRLLRIMHRSYSSILEHIRRMYIGNRLGFIKNILKSL